MTIYALDPGPTRSALVIMLESGCLKAQMCANADMRYYLELAPKAHASLVIEQVAGYGMPVGAEVFETVFWSGRFAETWSSHGGHWNRLTRRAVKLAICGSVRANDAAIRQAMLDKYGPGREKALGTRKAPGPLYGIKADLWQSLALAVTYQQQIEAAA